MKSLRVSPEEEVIPRHIAIIMDGNGRWAKKRGLPRTVGHKKGATAARNIVKACGEMGVSYITLYAFSSENWNRSAEEVNDLMALLRYYLDQELEGLHKQQVRISVIGDRKKLDDDILQKIEEAEALTKGNSRLHLVIALSYGSRQELAHATQRIAVDVQAGKIKAEEIDEHVIDQYLYTTGIPEPDLLIRTGGEQRLSNFLLWQSSYAELFFSKKLWPDFDAEALQEAVTEFQQRERRYGTA